MKLKCSPYVLIIVVLLFLFIRSAKAGVLENASSVSAAGAESMERRPVIGWIENVKIDDANAVFKARVDTGAGLASVNADILEIKKAQAGTPEYVVFQVQDRDGNKKTLKRSIVKWINIKKKGDTGFIKRPVVKLDFCLAGKKVEARANLADRKGFLYPILIGRNVLKAGDYIIDPQKKFTHEPACK
jgi:hypothetical protein